MKSKTVGTYDDVIELSGEEFRTILNYLYDLQNIRLEQHRELSELTESLLKEYTQRDDEEDEENG